ncbi:MAG: hypothetical protein ABI167_00460 [Nitrosospira sp.]
MNTEISSKYLKFQDHNNKPSVRLLLAALWLTNRANRSDPATQRAIAHHIHMVLLHPHSDNIDVQAAFDMAGKTGMDVDELLASFSAVMTTQ